jgi:hypothetical protein
MYILPACSTPYPNNKCFVQFYHNLSISFIYGKNLNIGGDKVFVCGTLHNLYIEITNLLRQNQKLGNISRGDTAYSCTPSPECWFCMNPSKFSRKKGIDPYTIALLFTRLWELF